MKNRRLRLSLLHSKPVGFKCTSVVLEEAPEMLEIGRRRLYNAVTSRGDQKFSITEDFIFLFSLLQRLCVYVE